MKCNAIIMYTDDSEGIKEVEFKKTKPSYEELSAKLSELMKWQGGGWEHVSVLYQGKQRDMFVDEIGRLLGLPINRRASEIYMAASIARGISKTSLIRTGGYIVGHAVLFTERVWF